MVDIFQFPVLIPPEPLKPGKRRENARKSSQREKTRNSTKKSESVKCRFSKAALVLSFKNWKIYSRWWAASKNKSKKPWASIFTLSPCGNRCRFSESAIYFSQVHPQLKIKLNNKLKHSGGVWLRWRLTLSKKTQEKEGQGVAS